MEDGIAGRTYNKSFVVANGTQPYSACSAPSGLPAGLTVNLVGIRCVVSGTPAAATAVLIVVTIQVADSSSPQRLASRTFSYNVRPEYAITSVPAMPDGVQSRSYGIAPQSPPMAMTSVSATVGNAPLTACTVTGAGGNTLSGTVVSGSNCAASATAANVSAPGAFPAVTYSVTDTPITDLTGAIVVPSNTIAVSTALNVQPPLSFPRNLNPIPDAVVGRTHGAPLTTLSFTVTGGLASRTLTSGITASPAGTNLACGAPGTTVTCSSGGANVAGATGAFTFTMVASDAGNSATPAGMQTTDTNGNSSHTITVQPPLSLTPNLNPIPDAAVGRTHGAPLTALAFTVTGGLASRTLTSGITASPAGTNLACTAPGTTVTCSSGGANVVGATGAFTFTMVASDAGNASTPPGVQTTDTNGNSSHTITVQPALTNTANLPVGPAPDAVQGRTYGMPAKMDLVFTTTGGLSGQAINVSSGVPPTGIVCAPAATTVTCNSGGAMVTGTTQTFTVTATDLGNASTPPGNLPVNATINVDAPLSVNAFVVGNVTEQRAITTPVVVGTSGGFQPTLVCSLSAGPAGLTVASAPGMCTISGTPNAGTAGVYPAFTVNATDGGNVTTPAPSSMASNSTALTDNPPLVLNAGAAIVFPQSTVNQPYAPPLDIPITGGNGPTSTYVCMDVGANLPASMTVSLVGTSCEISGTPSSTFINKIITIRVTDNASTSTAAGSTSQSGPLTINGPVSFTTTSPLLAGVKNRAYNFTLMATGGTQFAPPPPYHFSPTGPLTGTGTGDCAGLSLSLAGVISGTPTTFTNTPCRIAITVTDKAGSMATVSFTIPINDMLTITTTQAQFPNGLLGNPYTGLTFTATGGIGALTWVAPGANTPPCPVSGVVGDLDGLALSAGGVLSGTPAAASAAPNFFKPTICVFDTGNASTLPGFATKGFTFDVLHNFAYAAGTGTNTVEVINTSTNALVTSIGPLTGTPNGVAVTPNGRFAIVSQALLDAIDVIDTITNTAILGSPFPLAFTFCGTPAGVAVDAKFVYVACDGAVEEVLVLSAPALTTGTFTNVTEIPTGAATLPDSIAFKPDDTRAYVTLNGSDQMMIIDITLAIPAPIPATQGVNPAGIFDLPPPANSPREIVVVPNTKIGPQEYAYIAKETGPGGVIAFVGASNKTCVTPSAMMPTSLACALPLSTAAGNTVIVMVAIHNMASTVAWVTDTGGSIYALIPGCAQNNTVRIECWATAPNASIASGTVTVNLAAKSNFTMTVAEYSGVQSFGNVKAATASAANPSISVTTQDANNFCAAGFAGQGVGAFAALTGNLRTSGVTAGNAPPTSKEVGGALVDNIVAAPGACTTSVTNADTTWALAAVELRTGPAGVDVINVTADPSGVGTASLTPVTTVPEGGASGPFGLAVVPGTFARVYVTLNLDRQYDVIDNTAAVPTEIFFVGLPYNLPDPTAPATGNPVGVAIPPLGTVPGTGLPVFITLNNTSNVAVVNNAPVLSKANAKNTSFALTAASAPGRVSAIPVPK